MNRQILATFAACAFLSATAFTQDPGFMKELGPQKHRELMPIHTQMLEEQKKMDAELRSLLAAVDAATGEKRVDALIAVVSKLVEQRKAMNAKIIGHLDR